MKTSPSDMAARRVRLARLATLSAAVAATAVLAPTAARAATSCQPWNPSTAYVGGDTVTCCDTQGRIMVNGTPLDEPYIHPGNPPSTIRFTIKVPPGRLWVMGDHRSNSADSRYHMNEPGGGTVPENLVVGRAFVIAWPMAHWRGLGVPDTFASVAAPRADGMSPATAATMGKVTSTVGNRQALVQIPTPAELPLVMGVVGLRRVRWSGRSKLSRGVRSGCGGPGGRRTVRTWRARKAGYTGGRGRG